MESAGAVDTDVLINARRIGRTQFLVGILGGAALLVEGFDTSVIGYIAPQITRLWHVPNSTLGTILTADMVGLLTLALAVSATSTLWAAGIAMRLRTMQAGPVMQMPIFILMFLAPVYVPLALIAGWVHTVATYNPVSYMVEGIRSLVITGWDAGALWPAFGIAAAAITVFLALSSRALRTRLTRT